MKTYSFTVTGMTCSACSAHVEKSVKKLEGVERAAVNLLRNSLEVTCFDTLTPDAIIRAVEGAGYGASVRGDEPKATAAKTGGKSELRKMWVRLWVSVGLLIPLMYISMGHMVGLWLPPFMHGTQNALTFAFTQFLLMLPILIVNGKYFTGGIRSLFKGAPNMDTLIAVGSGAAVLYGIAAIYAIGYGLGHGNTALVEQFSMDLYFESAATIVTLITVGKYLEARSKGKTGEAVEKLLNLAPKTAVVLENGEEIERDAALLRVGDIVLVRPGAAVPADGIVLEGAASVDESAITGESVPVEKSEGDKVTGATINRSGVMRVQVTRVGEDTTLSRIVKLVEEAGGSKAPISKIADRVSAVFVPVVMSIALISVIIWLLVGQTFAFSLSIGIAVLVISCPCALGLATPTAIMVGTGQGAKNGVLFKSAEALENANKITAVVLDKTGTITMGKPSVTDSLCAPDCTPERLLALAASVEVSSEHPLAKAVVAYAEAQGAAVLPSRNFAMVAGGGVKAEVDGLSVTAGNARLMQTEGIDIAAFAVDAERLAAEGKTPLYFAADGKAVGLLALADTVKPDSQAAIAQLQAMELTVKMLTGDNERTAAAIAAPLGIEYTAEVLPEDKESVVRALQAEGHRVAMVGDGINDAPALARADVGIAIGAGTDIAIESAEVVLMKSTLTDAVTALRLSRATLRNIKENLFWAFFYNLLCIPLAAGVLFAPLGIKLNPMIAAAAMSLSSVCVVLNALRLRFFKANPNRKKEQPSAACPLALRNDCPAEAAEAPVPNLETNQEKGDTNMKQTVFIEGMSCGHCAARVEKALADLGLKATVDLAANCAAVEGNADADAIKKAIADAGYTVTDIR